MDETGGRELVERLEELANRFRPPSGAMVTVSLSAEEAQQVHDGLIAAAAHVAAEIEGERMASRPPA